MPIYEYECDDCGHQFEKLQKMNDAVLKDCPDCDNSSLRKLISAAGFKLKGSGWYETDFKNSKKSLTADETVSEKKSAATQTSKETSSKKKSDSKSAKVTQSTTN